MDKCPTCGVSDCAFYQNEKRARSARDPFFNPATNNLAYEQAKSAQQEVVDKLTQRRKTSVNLILDDNQLKAFVTEVINLQGTTKRVRVTPAEENDWTGYVEVDKKPNELMTAIFMRVNEDGKWVVTPEAHILQQLQEKRLTKELAESFGKIEE